MQAQFAKPFQRQYFHSRNAAFSLDAPYQAQSSFIPRKCRVE